RVGFGAAPESIINSILRVKEPFNVNSIAQAAAAAAITDQVHVEHSKQVNTEGREQLYKALSEFGLQYVGSMSNFILVEFGSRAKRVYEELLKQGVIVRYGDTWGMPQHIRISIGMYEENLVLIEVLRLILFKLAVEDIGRK
ncbi:MAG: aminotransferase class I/II-fold pyridoxal phosphate-dependent enzyme, partial [Bacillota bacterium]|nr:aminotransferase class I/II-fold pyridoxal phosphate-dependent enzyme [Bacillota bacterium]